MEEANNLKRNTNLAYGCHQSPNLYSMLLVKHFVFDKFNILQQSFKTNNQSRKQTLILDNYYNR